MPWSINEALDVVKWIIETHGGNDDRQAWRQICAYITGRSARNAGGSKLTRCNLSYKVKCNVCKKTISGTCNKFLYYDFIQIKAFSVIHSCCRPTDNKEE